MDALQGGGAVQAITERDLSQALPAPRLFVVRNVDSETLITGTLLALSTGAGEAPNAVVAAAEAAPIVIGVAAEDIPPGQEGTAYGRGFFSLFIGDPPDRPRPGEVYPGNAFVVGNRLAVGPSGSQPGIGKVNTVRLAQTNEPAIGRVLKVFTGADIQRYDSAGIVYIDCAVS